MAYTINENAVDIWVRDNADTMDLSIETDASSIYLENGRTLEQEVGKGTMVGNVVTVDSPMEKVVEGTYDGTYESCKMYGKSLVNLINFSNSVGAVDVIKNDDTITVTSINNNAWSAQSFELLGMAHNKTYIACWDSLTFTHSHEDGKRSVVGIYASDDEGNQVVVAEINRNQSFNYLIFTLPEKTDVSRIIRFRVHATTWEGELGATTTIKGAKVLEYQEGMENWDIPYFEGLCDVKMPILQTTGRNLLPTELSSNFEHKTVNGQPISNIDLTTFLKRGVRYVVKLATSKAFKIATFWSANSNNADEVLVAHGTISANNNNTRAYFTLPTNNESYYMFVNEHGEDHSSFIPDISQLVTIEMDTGEVPTTIEPYKTSILTTPEEVILRKVGDVCDSYDALTGEYVQRIGEVVLDGSEDWIANSTLNTTKTTFFFLPNPHIPSTWWRISAKWSRLPNNRFVSTEDRVSAVNQKIEWISGGDGSTGMIQILINTERLSTPDVSGFKQWLSLNPITVHYELETPITTTIEPSTIPFVYENGHIILESGYEGQSLLPTLEYSTVINRTGQIQSIANTVQKQEKQITKLEQMLIQNIVDLDYNNTLLTLGLEINEVI